MAGEGANPGEGVTPGEGAKLGGGKGVEVEIGTGTAGLGLGAEDSLANPGEAKAKIEKSGRRARIDIIIKISATGLASVLQQFDVKENLPILIRSRERLQRTVSRLVCRNLTHGSRISNARFSVLP